MNIKDLAKVNRKLNSPDEGTYRKVRPYCFARPSRGVLYLGGNMDKNRIRRVMWLVVVMVLIGCLMGRCGAEEWSDEQIANAIYRAENSAKYPYGIKSVNTFGNKDYARKICLNTIRNNRLRFKHQNRYDDFVTFLGSRYCPPTAHSLNKNWVKNVKYWLGRV